MKKIAYTFLLLSFTTFLLAANIKIHRDSCSATYPNGKSRCNSFEYWDYDKCQCRGMKRYRYNTEWNYDPLYYGPNSYFHSPLSPFNQNRPLPLIITPGYR